MAGFEPSGLVRSFRSGNGEVTLWFPGANLVAARVVGHVRAGLATAAFAEIDRYAISQGHPGRGFIDFSAMTNFDWDARMTLVRWNLAHRHEASRLDLLTDSLLAHIAVGALATILGGRLVAHEDRVTFEAAYTTSVAQRLSARPPADDPGVDAGRGHDVC
jgi:hypothetical protein